MRLFKPGAGVAFSIVLTLALLLTIEMNTKGFIWFRSNRWVPPGRNNITSVSVIDGVAKESPKAVLFLHFHKAGGTSIVSASKLSGLSQPKYARNGNAFEKTANGSLAIVRPSTMEHSELRLWLQSELTDGTRFLSMEWNFFPSPVRDVIPSSFSLVTCLREPWSRFLSTFNWDFVRNNRHKKVSGPDLESFAHQNVYWDDLHVKRRDKRLRQHFLTSQNKNNYYTLMLNGLANTENVKLERMHLDFAKEQIRCFDVIVVLERKATFAALESVGIRSAILSEMRLKHQEKVTDTWDGDYLRKVEERYRRENEYDYLLYEYASELATERLQSRDSTSPQCPSST